MKKFKIRIEEKLRRFVEVEAENYQDAEDELQRKYTLALYPHLENAQPEKE